MTTIIAGRFDNFETAGRAVETLKQRSFNAEDVSMFYVGPPGQHDCFPVGGDYDADAKSTEAHNEGLKGAAIGAGVGLAAAAAGPAVAVVAAAAGVGAYAGALMGALQGMEEDTSNEDRDSTVRKAGVMVAVNVLEENTELIATQVLELFGAQNIEKSQGEWRDGEWIDFDPSSPPHLIEAPVSAQQRL